VSDATSAGAAYFGPSSPATTENRPGILVVDDDRALLGLLNAVLSAQGFRVWTAPDGAAALELYRSVKEHIRVLLLDVSMPGLDGPATLHELRRGGATVPACFMSGYTARYSTEDLLEHGAERFFEKPFQIDVLAREVWGLAGGEQRQSA
jgi:DNA-binding response OmpR family regulator